MLRVGAVLLLLVSVAHAEYHFVGVWQCKFPGGEETLRIWHSDITSVQWVKADRMLSGNANERDGTLTIAWAEQSKEVARLSDPNTMIIERGKLRETCKRIERPDPSGYWYCREHDGGQVRYILIATGPDGALRKYENEREADFAIRWDEASGRGSEMTVGSTRWTLRTDGPAYSPKLSITITNPSASQTLDCQLTKRPYSFPQIPRAH